MSEQLNHVDDQVAKVADRLASEYAEVAPPGVVRGMVSEVYGSLRTARVQQFVPVLVDRSVRQQLRTAQH